MPRKSRPASVPMTADTRTIALHDNIAQQARKLWDRYGRPAGRDDEIWFEAERQVLGADRKANEQPGGAIPAAPLSDVFYPTSQPGPRTEPEVAQEREDRHGRQDGKLAGPGADTGLPK